MKISVLINPYASKNRYIYTVLIRYTDFLADDQGIGEKFIRKAILYTATGKVHNMDGKLLNNLAYITFETDFPLFKEEGKYEASLSEDKIKFAYIDDTL